MKNKLNIFIRKNTVNFLASFFLLLNFLLWKHVTSDIKYEFIITPYPPSKTERMILSLGDKEFLYRILGAKIQFAGDYYEQVTPLKNYDYKKLKLWFEALDELDPESTYMPTIAGYHYAYSQDPEHVRYIIPYLVNFGLRNPTKNWQFLHIASMLAFKNLNDTKLALEISAHIIKIPPSKDIPHWARVGMLFFIEQKDECAAINLMMSLNHQDLEAIAMDPVFSAGDGKYNATLFAILDRIERVKKDPSILQRCKNKKK